MDAYKEKLNERYFRTSNFYVAAFLFVKGLALVNVDKTEDAKRSYFVFRDAPERELLMDRFSFAEDGADDVLVDARKFVQATKKLKEALYQDTF